MEEMQSFQHRVGLERSIPTTDCIHDPDSVMGHTTNGFLIDDTLILLWEKVVRQKGSGVA